MTEAAIITPVVFLLVFAILEFGLLMRDNLTIANATREGTRAATTYGDELTSDYGILTAVENASRALPQSQIVRIVVFNAGSVDGQPTESCKNGTPSSTDGAECNVYTVADLARPSNHFGCKSTFDLDRYWCPTTRAVSQLPANGGPPDYVGLYIVATHDWVTGLWGESIMLTDQIVMRMEPQKL